MKQISLLGLSAAAAFCLGFAAEAAEPGPQLDKNCKMTVPQEQGQGHPTAGADSQLSDALANCGGRSTPPGSVPQQTPRG